MFEDTIGKTTTVWITNEFANSAPTSTYYSYTISNYANNGDYPIFAQKIHVDKSNSKIYFAGNISSLSSKEYAH